MNLPEVHFKFILAPKFVYNLPNRIMAPKRQSRASSNNTSVGKADEVKAGSESKVFLIKKSLIPEDDTDLEIISLTHPRTGAGAKFVIYGKQVYEITAFQEKYRCWFLGQSAVANGNLFMTTAVDPLFLALPLLAGECADRAVPVEQLFVDEDKLKNGRLLEVFEDDAQLELVADVKRSGDIKALKYNEKKTVAWLVRKCEKLVPKLMEHRIHCGTAATSANFVKSEKLDTDKDSKGEGSNFIILIKPNGA